MPLRAPITFHLPGHARPITAADPVWQEPIPIHRRMLQGTVGCRDIDSPSHGDYFTAVAGALSASGAEPLTRAASVLGGREVKASEIESIRVCLEKHGEFYHPARVSLGVGDASCDCVLNVAVTAAGRRLVQTEHRLLRHLHRLRPSTHIPRVFGVMEASTGAAWKWRMLLAEWFGGYHEFHLSVDPADGRLKTVVWQPTGGRRFLDPRQTFALYAGAAEILTFFFNPETFEHLSAWHHAAGDFVVRTRGAALDVKLVTVRDYRPLIGPAGGLTPGPRLTLEILLLYFVRLTIRMRLDRLDGAGEAVWADPSVMEAAAAGFFRSLDGQRPAAGLPAATGRCFRLYLSRCTRSDLLDIARAVCGKMDPGNPERGLVERQLERHAAGLHEAIQPHLAAGDSRPAPTT
jgi:hypothetical protein